MEYGETPRAYIQRSDVDKLTIFQTGYKPFSTEGGQIPISEALFTYKARGTISGKPINFDITSFEDGFERDSNTGSIVPTADLESQIVAYLENEM